MKKMVMNVATAIVLALVGWQFSRLFLQSVDEPALITSDRRIVAVGIAGRIVYPSNPDWSAIRQRAINGPHYRCSLAWYARKTGRPVMAAARTFESVSAFRIEGGSK